ncbi:hypothetical protein HLH33_12985 [Gluconacetobacter diazotrophicus]|uniref:DUF6362 domain-containing protein n=1 Tax=Gluconacetobacter diazotrophicus TaxID=33996 RepID=A0A7W4NGB5_GLUDI|nr:DUF6362 family protein [Gluconacetobacter diazotrophicus]MBB2157214.1 hypothetical protein [Gluconacetobacter diazotrophicus]
MRQAISLADGLSWSDVVSQRLFEAACTLAVLPMHGLRPANVRVAWPEIMTDADPAWIDAMPDDSMRMPRPTAKAIGRMDEALGWLAVIGNDRMNWRRAICLRLVVHPISHRHRWPWRAVGRKLGVDYKTAQSWHERGISTITKKIAQPEFSTSQTPQKAIEEFI